MEILMHSFVAKKCVNTTSATCKLGLFRYSWWYNITGMLTSLGWHTFDYTTYTEVEL